MHHPPRRTLTAVFLSLLLVLGIALAPATAHASEISSEQPHEQAWLDLDGLWDLILEWLGLSSTNDASTSDSTDTTLTESSPTDENLSTDPILEGFGTLSGDDGGGDEGDNGGGFDPEG